ncbi:hypothetical protein [Nostoc sp.]|uniref:hypothetical protein n=1 Tax=Nostoc sp. TaxID=1180 RepID=UPI002FFB2C93
MLAKRKLFLRGEAQLIEIASMPGCYRYSLDLLLKEIAEVSELGINTMPTAVNYALFPVIPELRWATPHQRRYYFNTRTAKKISATCTRFCN